MKKTWIRPEIKVLVRGNSEESVLSACKDRRSNGPQGGGHTAIPCTGYFAGGGGGKPPCTNVGIS